MSQNVIVGGEKHPCGVGTRAGTMECLLGVVERGKAQTGKEHIDPSLYHRYLSI